MRPTMFAPLLKKPTPRPHTPMWDCYLLDLNYLASDLVSGKSLPILIAVSTLNLDPNLMGTMVVVGVLLGTASTLLITAPAPNVVLTWAVRALNHAFGALLSLAFLARIAGRVHPSGDVLALLPAFCVALQPVQERPSTPFALLVLSLALFWAGILYEFDPAQPVAHSRKLLALSRHDWYAQRHPNHYHPRLAPDAPTQSVYDSARYSLTVLALAFYASAQHGPIRADSRSYTSPLFLAHRAYAVWPALSAAMLRAYVYLRTGWLHGNPMHISLEHDPALEDLSMLCTWIHMVVLLYSAAWTLTQLADQVLTVVPGSHRPNATALILALAYLFRWRDPWAGFLATIGVGAATLIAALFGAY